MSDQNPVKSLRQMPFLFDAHLAQKDVRQMPEPHRGNVFTQMCAICAHHLPQKLRITQMGLGRCSPFDGLISSPTPNAGRVG